MEEKASVISIQAFRFDPDRQKEGYLQSYEVAVAEPLSAMALLAKIHELDSSFACRTSTCFKGQCGSCLIRVNGQDVLGCVTLVRPGESVILEPHSGYRVIRDVVVDFSQPREG
jgi:succinate dehydrogenase/fumarate reductase-like Fe-S protein